MGEPSNKKVFNFNPLEKKLDSFIDQVLAEAFMRHELLDLQAKQALITTLRSHLARTDNSTEKRCLNTEIFKLKHCILEGAKGLWEKIRFTYTGFDISGTPIPTALIACTEDILKCDIVDLLSRGYLLTQIYSVFGTTDAGFDSISKKGIQLRDDEENRVYTGVLDLYSGVINFRKLFGKDISGTKKDSSASLESIRSMGEEGEKIYSLLNHLLPSPEMNDAPHEDTRCVGQGCVTRLSSWHG